MGPSGSFVPYLLTFDDKTNEEQAAAILEEARRRIDGGATGIGITYSANYGQTQVIRRTYAAGEWNTHTRGSNQADVMARMETLMASEPTMQGKLRIVPITTMTYTSFGGHTLDEVIDQDMGAIGALVEEGWTILGWMNQRGSRRFAVGGGIAKGWYAEHPDLALSPEQSDRIQAALTAFVTAWS